MSVENIERMQIRLADIAELLPYVRNSRRHSEEQVKLIAASITEFGWTNPILTDGNNGLIAGHGRLAAAQLLGLTRVPVIDLSHLTEHQKRAYVISDNQLANFGTSWDMEMLRVEIEDLEANDFDLGLLGFTDDELDNIMVPEVEETDADPDECPEPAEDPHSVLGDMWICGPHRVRCGDSTSVTDWDDLMQGEKADIQACDPPYNVAYESKLAGSIKNDDMGNDEFREFLLGFFSCSYSVMKAGAPMYVAHSDSEGINFRQTFVDAGFKLSGCLTWKKNALVLGRMDYQAISEPILYGWREGSKHRWFGGRKNVTVQEVGEYPPFQQLEDGRYAIIYGDQVLYVNADAVFEQAPSSIIEHAKPRRSSLHPTMKPVALWEKLLINSARSGDIVIDGFGGSGTTLMAAERLGMCARVQEFDPKFADVIVKRWQNYTGRRAVHAVTGEPFPELPNAEVNSEIC